MKQLLFGNESDQQSDIVLAQLSQEMYNTGLILALLRNLHRIGECKFFLEPTMFSCTHLALSTTIDKAKIPKVDTK